MMVGKYSKTRKTHNISKVKYIVITLLYHLCNTYSVDVCYN